MKWEREHESLGTSGQTIYPPHETTKSCCIQERTELEDDQVLQDLTFYNFYEVGRNIPGVYKKFTKLKSEACTQTQSEGTCIICQLSIKGFKITKSMWEILLWVWPKSEETF